ncbi:class I SAM-dependent methyltransferase [Streptomyces sp. NPDC060209]|uniref:class I SAM-dependent methyltransferase n=1 Tax=Streptomyces sp. NPDC060209 TaxID=3347073 RepID=UPI00365B58F8
MLANAAHDALLHSILEPARHYAMTEDQVNNRDVVKSWTHYGQVQLDRGYMPPVPEQLRWCFWDGVGPGDEVLGPLQGRRVLDIGSGPGHHGVHLARTHGAFVDAVELSPTQHQRAVGHFANEPHVRFVNRDVVDHLRHEHGYDVAYAINTLACTDPRPVLAALRDGLLDGARLVFCALHTGQDAEVPSATVDSRLATIHLKDQKPIPVRMWVLAPELWTQLLIDHDFTVAAISLLRAPDDDNPVVVQLVQARRNPRGVTANR